LSDKSLVSFISNCESVVSSLREVKFPFSVVECDGPIEANSIVEKRRPKTMISLPDSPDTVSPDDVDQRLVTESSRQLAGLLAGRKRKSYRLTIDGEECEIPGSALRMLKDILVQLSKGNSVTLMPIHAELTTQEAADLLSVSRPYLVGLLEAGKIPFHKAGSHRRIVLNDLMAYKKQQELESDAAMLELAREAQELALGYDL